MARNYFNADAGDVLQAGQAGWDDTQGRISGLMKRRGDVRAAPRIAAGDYAGAAEAYGEAGDAAGALGARVAGDRAEDRSLKLADDQTARAEHTQDRAHEDTERRAAELKQLTAALRQVPKGQRAPFLQHALPILQQATGMDVAPFQTLREEDLTDDHLASFDGEVDKHIGVALGSGGYGSFNPRTGDFKTLREPDKPLILGNGASAYDADGNLIARNAKTFAPPRARSGGGGGGLSSVKTEDLIAALRR